MRSLSFPVRTYEVDSSGKLAPAALVGYLLELAFVHAIDLDCGMEHMFARGYTWVLSRLRMAVERSVSHAEVLTVETWPSGTDRLFALRDFRVRDEKGMVVAHATSQWLVLSLETRRAVWPEEAVSERVRAPGERVFDEPFIKIPPMPGVDEERRIETRYQDIDQNDHITSRSYVGWALEALPLATLRSERLTFLEVHYLAECHHPGVVVARSKSLGDGRFQHSVVREADGVDAARLTTRWAPRA